MNNNKKSFVIIIILLIFVAIIGLIKSIVERNERNEHTIENIAKITGFKGASKRQYLDFKFYHDNKVYFNEWYRGSHPNVKIGEYYKIIYSSKNPKNVEIFLDERITDTVLIKKSGFEINSNVSDW